MNMNMNMKHKLAYLVGKFLALIQVYSSEIFRVLKIVTGSNYNIPYSNFPR